MTEAPTHCRGLAVQVPASTSNLGPGFDFMGLALSLAARVRIASENESEHTISRAEGAAVEWPRDRENLLFRAFDDASARLGARRRKLAFEVASEIPIARGLGSSGAAVAAGILLARECARSSASLDDCLAWGTSIERHPDNVCAALVGGCTLSVPLPDGRVRVVRQPLHESLGFVIAWSDHRLTTGAARRVLPREVPFADAVENPRRLALLLEGLRTGDADLLRSGEVDRLHVAHRLPLIPGGREALAAAHESGAWLATISGSGSALFAIAARDRTKRVGETMRAELARRASDAWSRVVEPVYGTPAVTRDV